MEIQLYVCYSVIVSERLVKNAKKILYDRVVKLTGNPGSLYFYNKTRITLLSVYKSRFYVIAEFLHGSYIMDWCFSLEYSNNDIEAFKTHFYPILKLNK